MSFKPIYNPSSELINAFLAGHQTAMDKQKLALEQERLSQEKEIEEERLKQEHELQTKHIDILQQAHELQKLMDTQSIQNKYLESGSLPSGSTVTRPNITQGVQGNPTEGFQNLPVSTIPGLTADQVKLNIPGLGESISSSPEAVAKTSGELAALRAKPTFDLESQRELAKQVLLQKSEEAKSKLALELEDKRLQSTALQNEINRHTQLAIAQGNNAARIAAAGVTKNTSLIKDTLDKYDTHDVTKRFNILKEAKDVSTTIDDNSSDPVMQRNLVYAYAKALDPQKVSTIGEADAIKNNLQSIADSFGLKVDSILGNQASFLKPAAIKSMKQAIQSRYALENTALQNLRGQMGQRLKSLGGDPNFLTDYSQTSQDTTKQDLLDKLFPKKK